MRVQEHARHASIRGTLALVAAIAVAASAVPASCAESTESKSGALRAKLQTDLNNYLHERSAAEHLSALALTVSFGAQRPPIVVTSGTTTYRGTRRATATDLYQIGSNTKAFTAVAALRLEAQGRLSIDAPIGKYLPQYPAYRALTLRRLLNMTAGLESYDNTPAWEQSFVRSPAANVSAATSIGLVYPHEKFRAGTRYHYSNTGYLLAQKIIDARSRSGSYPKEIARLIADAGLSNTFYSGHVYPRPIARRVVAGYYENDDSGFGVFLGKDMSGYSLSWAQGAGAIVSTTQDLATWARELYRGTTLLPRKQHDELMSLISVKTAQALALATARDPAGFGLGVAQRFHPKLGAFWFYQGETLGFRAAHLYFPKSDLVVCIFANSRPVEAKSKIQSLFLKVYDDIGLSR